MSQKDSILEFLSRPTEWHAFGAGTIFSYLGLYHQPLLQFTGFNVLTPLAFGIGLMIIGVSTKSIRDVCNKVILPEKTQIPDDIKNEWIYYWTGIFSVYFVSSLLPYLSTPV